jgi:hypothetical protein
VTNTNLIGNQTTNHFPTISLIFSAVINGGMGLGGRYGLSQGLRQTSQTKKKNFLFALRWWPSSLLGQARISLFYSAVCPVLISFLQLT